MDEDNASLSVGFSIEFGDAFGQLRTLDDIIGEVQARAVREFQKMEQASKGAVNLGPAVVTIQAFGNAVSREAKVAAQELGRVERAGEALVAQLERQNSTFGKSRDEVRAMKVETAALAAEERGLTELAGRLRTEQTLLVGQQNAAAEARQREAVATRDAAAAHQAFEAAARKGMQALREREAAVAAADNFAAKLNAETAAIGKTTTELKQLEIAQRAANAEAAGMPDQAARIRAAGAAFADATLAAERDTQAVRDAGAAYEAFEARVREGVRAMREQEAAQQAAISSASAYAAKLEAETAAIGRTTAELRQMEVARRAAEAEAGGAGDQAARIRAAGAAYAQAETRAASLAAEVRRVADADRAAAEAARQLAAAQAAQDSAVNSLRSSVDPLHGAQQRLSREMESAARLYRAGAIGQAEYERSSAALATQLDQVQRAALRASDTLPNVSRASKLGAADLTNIGFQLQDIGVSLAGGQNPLLVLIQQGSQLGGIMAQTGASVGDMARAIGGLFVVTRPTAAATAALAAAEVAQATALAASQSAGATAAITAAELAVAEQAAARAATGHTAAQTALATAQARATAAAVGDTAALTGLTAAEQAAAAAASELAFAQNAVTLASSRAAGANEVATAAAAQLAAAQQAATGASNAAAASATRSLAPWLATAGLVGAAVGVLGVGLYALNQNMEKDAGLKKYAAGLGLTRDEMKKLGDQSVTAGDMMKGLATTLGVSFEGVGKTIKGWTVDLGNFFGNVVKGIAASTYGLFVGSYRAIVETWSKFPAALGDLFVQAVNAAASGIEALVNKSIGAVNALAAGANGLLGFELFGKIEPVQVSRMENKFAGDAKAVGKAWSDSLNGAVKEGLDGIDRGMAAWTKNSRQAALDRLKKDADKIKADRTPEQPKVDRTAERLARENSAIEAQIRNLYLLADAYRVSSGAALIAEARVKAESDAIKKRGDVELFVNRQVRLAIAERVRDAVKSSAGMYEQAEAQEQINASVAAGLIPSGLAADLVRDQIADLPLLAALQAAQQRGLATEAAKATEALEEQRQARARLKAAETTARFNADMESGANRLAELREELRLVGATDAARARALTTLRATQEADAKGYTGPDASAYVAQQVKIADETERLAAAQRDWNDALNFTADKWSLIADNIQAAAGGMADAFGGVGRAIGDVASIYADFEANRARADTAHGEALRLATTQGERDRENARYALATQTRQIGLYGDLTSAAKDFFKQGSGGYRALATAEKAFRAVELAMAVKNAAVQLGLLGTVTTARVGAAATGAAADTAFTGTSVANSGLRAAADGVAAVAKAIASLPFPANLVAGAATAAAIAALGISIVGGFGGGKNTLPKANEGAGTVFGDRDAKSESIKRAVDQLREVDTLTNTYARQMAGSLRSIESQIGGFAALVVRAGEVNASGGVTEGFKPNLIGSVLGKIPLIGGFLSSLFGSKTEVVGGGLYGKSQSLGSILDSGFDAQTYSDVKKTKKFFGIKTSTSYSTRYGEADAGLENQFTLILRDFNAAITAAAGPLGAATADIQNRLNGFVVNIGNIDLQGLTGAEIEEKLTAIFGAAADNMAAAAFPGMERFQKVGEGMFETLVRVSSTVEAVTNALGDLGTVTTGLGIDAKVGLAGQFDSIGDLTSAADAYFQAFYTKEEQRAAKLAQLGRVFGSLNLAMPETLAGYRALVDAQNLATAAGQSTYATLLQLAPAFADLQAAMDGARSAADILAEKQDLERKLLEVRGDTAAIRALDLAKLDVSNRALQQQIWAVQDAQEAAKAADQLRDAWKSVGDGIMDEVRRIRGLNGVEAGGGFAALLGRFNATSDAARAGDLDAAKLLPGLSQALLTAAGQVATSRQELNRVQAQTAASLEATNAAIARLGGAAPAASVDALVAAATASQAAATPAPANDDMAAELRALREEVKQLRADNNAGHAATAGNTGRIDRRLEDVTAASGGEAISVASAA